MQNNILGYASLFISTYNQMDQNMEKWKEEIREEWKNSANYPRKKKKRVRKELLLDWSIANASLDFNW